MRQDHIVCMMPFADGYKLHSESFRSIAQQTIDVHLMPITRPKDHFTFGKMPQVFVKKIRTERKGISTCRNILRELALELEDEFILHVDTDVVLASDHDVEDMLQFMEENPRVAVLGLNTKNFEVKKLDPPHIPMACLMFRRGILGQIIFHNSKYFRKCNCQMLCQDVRKIDHPDGGKWEVRYLDDRHLKEIGR